MLDLLNIEEIKPLGEKAIDLFVESYSNSARIVQIRGLTKNEVISGDHTTSGDRSLATLSIPITDIPISLAVRTAATSVKRGECYVRVSLRIEGAIVAVLCAGYATDSGALIYPNGKIESSTEGPGLIRSITGTDPAANTEISETVPTGAIWKLKSIRIVLVTDATVIARLPQLLLTDGTNVLFTSGIGPTVSQSTTLVLTFADGLQEELTSIVGMGQVIPADSLLLAGYKMTTTTTSFQAGDNFGAPQLLVEEWISP